MEFKSLNSSRKDEKPIKEKHFPDSSSLKITIQSLFRMLREESLSMDMFLRIEEKKRRQFLERIFIVNRVKLGKNPTGRRWANRELLFAVKKDDVLLFLEALLEGANPALKEGNENIFSIALRNNSISIVKLILENDYLRRKIDFISIKENGNLFPNFLLDEKSENLIELLFQKEENFKLIRKVLYQGNSVNYDDKVAELLVLNGFDPIAGKINGKWRTVWENCLRNSKTKREFIEKLNREGIKIKDYHLFHLTPYFDYVEVSDKNKYLEKLSSYGFRKLLNVMEYLDIELAMEEKLIYPILFNTVKRRKNKTTVRSNKLLHYANEGNLIGIIKSIHEGDVNVVDFKGRNFLHILASEGHLKELSFFLKRRKAFNVVEELVYEKDKEGLTILGIALKERKALIVEFLTSAGFNPIMEKELERDISSNMNYFVYSPLPSIISIEDYYYSWLRAFRRTSTVKELKEALREERISVAHEGFLKAKIKDNLFSSLLAKNCHELLILNAIP